MQKSTLTTIITKLRMTGKKCFTFEYPLITHCTLHKLHQVEFKKTWLENIQNNSKTLNYRFFKDKLEFHKYFDILEEL